MKQANSKNKKTNDSVIKNNNKWSFFFKYVKHKN